MGPRVSQRLRDLPASPTLAVNSRAKAMLAQGRDVLSFAAGEPDFDTPAFVRSAARAAMDEGQTRYTAVPGLPALREAICEHTAKLLDVSYTASEVVVSCGAKHSLYLLFQAILEPGDAVIVPAPFWVSYPAQIGLAGGQPVIAPTRASDGFLLDVAGLNEALDGARRQGHRPRALILNSPTNPTGAAYERSGLEALVTAALNEGLLIISDEIYHRITYDGFQHVSAASLSEQARRNTFLVNGVSKTWAMTGWRIGWVSGDAEVLAAMGRLQSQSTSNPSSVSQAAALAALQGSDGFIGEWLAKYDERRRSIVEALNQTPGIRCTSPRGAFYVFPSIEGLIGRRPPGEAPLVSDEAVALWLLSEVGVATVPGTPFGAPGHLRLSYATSLERVEQGMARLQDAVGRLEA